MNLDAHFIKSLRIPFNAVLPTGSITILRDEFAVSEHTPRRVLSGDWSNPEIILAAIRQVEAHKSLLERFLQQFKDKTSVKTD